MDTKESLQHLQALNFAMKPMLVPRIGGETGGAVAARASPPALSPNLPSIKLEPRLPSPCVASVDNSGGGSSFSPTKRLRVEDGTWLPSPSSQMSIDSLSPPPLVNGHNNNFHNGLSPTSVSSYDSYSPKGSSVSAAAFHQYKDSALCLPLSALDDDP